MSLVQRSIPLALPLDAVPIEKEVLPYPYKSQHVDGLCWAACIAMVVRNGWSVKEVVTAILGKHCNRSSIPIACRRGVPIDRVAQYWNHEAFELVAEEKELDDSVVRDSIELRKHPVEAMYGRTHLILIIGTCVFDDSTKGFVVHDPLEGRKGIPLSWRSIVSGKPNHQVLCCWEIHHQLEAT